MTDAPVAPPSAIDLLRLLFRFNDWTFPQLFRALARVSDEQLRQPGAIAGGVRDGAIFSALGHIVYNEDAWLVEWMEAPGEASTDRRLYATLESTVEQWETIKKRRDAWLAAISDQELTRVFKSHTAADGSTRDLPLWPVLFNIPIHNAHHRAEMYEALTKFGAPPAEEPDLITFVQTHSENLPASSVESDSTEPSAIDLVRLLYDFTDWAGQHLIRAVSRLPEAELNKPGAIAGGAEDGSIHAMLSHIVGAEGYWLSRWTNSGGGDTPSTASLAERWDIICQNRRAWLKSAGAGSLSQVLSPRHGDDGVIQPMPLWPALIHVPIHTTHHRAEIYAALTGLGYPPEQESHVIFYLEEQLLAAAPSLVISG